MKCPRCKLFNPPEAERCDCGYDFRTLTVEQSYLRADGRAVNSKAADREMAWGAAIAGVGIVASGISYSLATPGGTYVVTYGLVIVGALRFFRGMAKR